MKSANRHQYLDRLQEVRDGIKKAFGNFQNIVGKDVQMTAVADKKIAQGVPVYNLDKNMFTPAKTAQRNNFQLQSTTSQTPKNRAFNSSLTVNRSSEKGVNLSELLSSRKGSIFGTSFKPAPKKTMAKIVQDITLNRSAAHETYKPLKLPVYGEDSIGITRNFQAMLVKSNNDDDFETGEVQAKRATDFCLREVNEGLDDREDDLQAARSDDNSDREWGEGSSKTQKTKRIFECTPMYPYSQGESLQETNKDNDDSAGSRRSSCDF